MAGDAVAREALKAGRRQAEAALRFRDRQLQLRRRALGARRKPLRTESAPPVAPDVLKALGGGESAGVLMAEGDSWFDYPLVDILRLLEDRYGYDVESVARRGDRIEDMAYGAGQLEELARRLERLLRRSEVPKAVLLSGGGNDVVGSEFGMLVNHALSPIAGLNPGVVGGVIDERIRLAYITILSGVTRLCEARLGRPVPILVHGYDYPVPDGRGYLGGWWLLPGPWLEPGFREKGYGDVKTRAHLARQLIDRFNAMLERVAAIPDFAHVRYIDLRRTLSGGRNYRKDWADEMHPSPSGFRRLAERFAAVIADLPRA